MTVELHCSHCGALVRAPSQAAGRWGKCPRCGHKIYVPTPADEVSEEIPLVPLDEQEERRAQRQRDRDRRLEAELLEGGGDASGPAPPVESGEPVGTPPAFDPLTEMLLRYVRGMAQGRLADCDSIVAALVGKRKAVTHAVERLLAAPPPGAEVDDLPLPVVGAYLKQLLSQL